jgi:cytochrome c-type biogenesis protein
MFADPISYSAAFVAGLLSFFSPCVLPLIPAYFTFISGSSLEELTAGENEAIRRRVIVATLAFISGFSMIFIMLGASASFLGGLAHNYRGFIRIGGGLLIIIFGLHLLGILRIPFLDYERKIRIQSKPVGIVGAVLVGMAFGAGWSPCAGPQLGSILALAMGKGTVWHGVGLLSVYSAGLALPFMGISLFIHYLLVFIRKTSQWMPLFNRVAGSILILIGILLLTDKLVLLNVTG